MKILIITAAFPPARAPEADHAFHLCQRIADSGHEVHVLTTKGSVTLRSPGIIVYPIMRNWAWLDVARFARFIGRCSPDAVLLMYIGWIYNFHPMITFAPSISKILLPRIPFVTQFENAYGAEPWRASFLSRAALKCVARWATAEKADYNFGTLLSDSDRVIVLSDRQRDMLSKRFPGVTTKSVLIPPAPIMHICPEDNGAARQRGRELLGLKPSDFLILYYGYMYPGKGIETLLRAFQIVSTQRSKVRLIVVGGNTQSPASLEYAREISQLCEALSIQSKITWIGEYPWDSDEGSLYFRAADICVLPFDIGVYLNNSSFGAAAAHGLPIVTTHGAILERPFVHRENVFLCPPKSPDAMAVAIKTLIDEPNLRQRLHVGALQLAQEWFSWDAVVKRTMAIFKHFDFVAASLPASKADNAA